MPSYEQIAIDTYIFCNVRIKIMVKEIVHTVNERVGQN